MELKELKELNWYNKFKEVIANGGKPYKIVKIVSGMPEVIARLKDVRINAVSPAQARLLFFKKYPWLREYVETGFTIEAMFDKEGWLKSVEDEKIRKEQETKRNQQKEEDIQEMWWNK